jgi:glucan 1,3-beta-glucosidase
MLTFFYRYFQSNPDALAPFKPNADWNDPDFASCSGPSCIKTWGLRVLDTTDFYLYGGGLYSFFENYAQQCLDNESCQDNMIEVDCSEVYMFGVSTKASKSMITSSDGEQLIPQIENRSNFCSTIAMFTQS